MPFCRKCGAEVVEGDKFCTNCGSDIVNKPDSSTVPEPVQETPPPPPPPPPPPSPTPTPPPAPDPVPAPAPQSTYATQAPAQQNTYAGQEAVQAAQAPQYMSAQQNTSGQGSSAVIPDEIRGWSWGGFFLNFIWGIGNKVWISLLALVPYVGLIMCIVLGVKGNQWAWQHKQWDSVEHFKSTQRKWAIAGLIVFVLAIILTVAVYVIPTLISDSVSDSFSDSLR